jgi:sterol-4alpha-carboxylate 3-dehydrogenase (decarboxylating)
VDVKRPEDSLTQIPNLQYFEASTTSPDDLLQAFQAARPQVVIHSAAIIPPLSERYGRRLEKVVFEVNIAGTRHALDAAQRSGCSAFVYTSSCCAVTDDMSIPYINIDERWPVSPVSSIYGESKVRCSVHHIACLQ